MFDGSIKMMREVESLTVPASFGKGAKTRRFFRFPSRLRAFAIHVLGDLKSAPGFDISIVLEGIIEYSLVTY